MTANVSSPTAAPSPIHAVVAVDFAAVNRTIMDQLNSRIPLVETIGQYIIESGGKRLRPLLVLLAARALGYQGERHVTL
ncbi:MAG: polyprenyl synthetase family protein, partial [Planctomycetes bacterium]|nr:polyprenyl synthetase family protein [Planctomycetota bacterium]